MKQELVDTIVSRSENIDAAFSIHWSIEGVKLEIIKMLKEEIQISVKEKFELEVTFDDNFGEAESEFNLFKKDWAYKITFGFGETQDYDNPWIGVENKGGISSQTQEDKDLIQKALEGNLHLGRLYVGNPRWIWCSDLEELNDVSWSEMKNKYTKEIITTLGNILANIKHIIEKPIIN